MPELPEVETVRRGLQPVMEGARILHAEARRKDLRFPFQKDFVARLTGQTVTGLGRRAKYLMADLGSGDVAFRAAKASGAGFRATVCDINADMLSVGRDRAAKRHLDDRVSFVDGNAEGLAFPDRSFDGYTIAFGIRNVPRIDLALKEAYRVLKPGGRFLCLEFSSVDVPGLDRLYDLFSFRVIPQLGRAVTGDAESYQYLVESIRKFPKPAAFADMIRSAGFARVNWQTLSGGIVALHSGWRL